MGSVSAAVDWLMRARRMIPRDDRRILLSPPRLIARFLRFAAHRVAGRAGQVSADDVRARDPELVSLLLDLWRVVAHRYFRMRVAHVENVPASGPVLLVGNHSGGLVPTDGFFASLAIHDHLGPARAVYSLVHDFVFEDPVLRRYAGRLGMLRAGHESARHAFAEGAAVLVYPGSDIDTFRPFRDRNRVDLGGRTGFLTLALREGVPIVPVVTAGTQEQFIVLTRGDRLAKRLRAHLWARAEVLPLILAVPWGLTLGFVPYIPLPAQATIAFLPPMRWPELGPADAEDPAVLARCYREVEQAMQAALDDMTEGRRFLLGKPEPRKARPAVEVHAATEIEASADVVWRALTDLEHFGEWNPFIREASGTTDVGGTVHVRVQPTVGPRLPLHATILARDAHELRWKGSMVSPWVGAGEHTFSIEPVGAHRVRFEQHEVFTGMVPRVIAPLLARETQRGFDAMNLALKARVEGADRARPWMLLAPRTGPSVRIESVGSALPAQRLTTADLMARTRHRTRIDLERLTGIRERRVCSPGEDSRTLAIAAARDCLSRSRHTAADLDVVISASITHYVDGTTHRIEPPLSLSIKEAIGADRATSFDLSNACAGMLTGVFLLDAMIRRGEIHRGMVVSGEAISGLGTNAARSIRSIFSLQLASLTLGDGGAAVIVERAPDGRPGILLAGFTTLAEHSRLCLGLPAPHAPGARMFTRARKIHEVAMADGPPLIDEVLAAHGLRLGDIDWMIPHQTSVRAIRSGERALAERLGDHPKHMVITVDEYGNTASTTLFIALDKYLREGRLAAGDKVLLLSVASGLEVGIVVLAIDGQEEAYEHAH